MRSGSSKITPLSTVPVSPAARVHAEVTTTRTQCLNLEVGYVRTLGTGSKVPWKLAAKGLETSRVPMRMDIRHVPAYGLCSN